MVIDRPKKAPEGQALASQPTKIQPRKEVVQEKPKEKEIPILGGNKGLLFLKSCQGGQEIQMNNKQDPLSKKS